MALNSDRSPYLVVKSISLAGLNPPSAAFSHVHPPTIVSRQSFQASKDGVPEGREPHGHVDDSTSGAFSLFARSQVHSPAGRARHEQRGPETVFSLDDLAQLQLRAEFWPHEQVACWAGLELVTDQVKFGSGRLTTGALGAILAAASGRLGDSHSDVLKVGSGEVLEMCRSVFELV